MLWYIIHQSIGWGVPLPKPHIEPEIHPDERTIMYKPQFWDSMLLFGVFRLIQYFSMFQWSSWSHFRNSFRSILNPRRLAAKTFGLDGRLPRVGQLRERPTPDTPRFTAWSQAAATSWRWGSCAETRQAPVHVRPPHACDVQLNPPQIYSLIWDVRADKRYRRCWFLCLLLLLLLMMMMMMMMMMTDDDVVDDLGVDDDSPSVIHSAPRWWAKP